MKRLTAFFAIAWLLVVAGCNTMQGLGKDIEQLGENIQRKSSK